MKPLFVYITCKNEEEALSIGKTVVQDQLAACANLLPGMRSVYMWKEELQVDEEVVLILKTHDALFADLTEQVIELHSYDVPCVVALPILGGNPAYLEWMAGEMRV